MDFTMLIAIIFFLICTNLFIYFRYRRSKRWNRELFIRSWKMESMLVYIANSSGEEESEIIKEFLEDIKPLS